MALIPVRSTQPGPDGETFVTEVGAEHLERWPDDYTPLAGEELARYQLERSGVDAEHLDEAIAAVLAAQPAAEPAPESESADPADADQGSEPVDGSEAELAPTAKHAAPVDPSVSTD